MVLLLKMITNLRSRGAPAAIKCSRLGDATTNTSWHIKDSKTLFQSGNLPLFSLERTTLTPSFLACLVQKSVPSAFIVTDDLCSFLWNVGSKNPATTQGKWRHYSVFNFNPSRTGICSVFSGVGLAGQSNRIFRIILWIFQNEVNRQQFSLLFIFSITLYNPCGAEYL